MLIVLDIDSEKMFYVLIHIVHDMIRENYGQLKIRFLLHIYMQSWDELTLPQAEVAVVFLALASASSSSDNPQVQFLQAFFFFGPSPQVAEWENYMFNHSTSI